jgi:hypothetical protein
MRSTSTAIQQHIKVGVEALLLKLTTVVVGAGAAQSNRALTAHALLQRCRTSASRMQCRNLQAANNAGPPRPAAWHVATIMSPPGAAHVPHSGQAAARPGQPLTLKPLWFLQGRSWSAGSASTARTSAWAAHCILHVCAAGRPCESRSHRALLRYSSPSQPIVCSSFIPAKLFKHKLQSGAQIVDHLLSWAAHPSICERILFGHEDTKIAPVVRREGVVEGIRSGPVHPADETGTLAVGDEWFAGRLCHLPLERAGRRASARGLPRQCLGARVCASRRARPVAAAHPRRPRSSPQQIAP